MADFVTVRIPWEDWETFLRPRGTLEAKAAAVAALSVAALVDVAVPECVRRWQLLDYADQRAAIDCLNIDELRVETAADCLEWIATAEGVVDFGGKR